MQRRQIALVLEIHAQFSNSCAGHSALCWHEMAVVSDTCSNQSQALVAVMPAVLELKGRDSVHTLAWNRADLSIANL